VDNEAVLAQRAENFRFYGDMRFKQLTLFMAAMTAVGAGVMQFPENRSWIALGGLFVTAVMWVVEVRATLNAIAAHNAIPEVFPPHRAFMPWLNSSCAVLMLHIVCYGSWLWCVGAWCASPVPLYAGALIGPVLVVFSVVNYWRQRKFWLAPR
jgi:hypothetical protein